MFGFMAFKFSCVPLKMLIDVISGQKHWQVIVWLYLLFAFFKFASNSQGARILRIDLAQLSSQKRFDFRNS